MAFIEFRHTKIHYEVYGKEENPAVLLLHGYLESLKIWEPFIPLLANDYFVIAIDIPGHGKSGIFSRVHRMDDMAEAAFHIIQSLGVGKVHIVGHSMGGYVALAFRELHYRVMRSFTLFHSTSFSDTPEKRMNRIREIELIKDGKKNLIVKTNIPKAFANDNLERLKSQVNTAMQIAMDTEDEGIISILNGMKERPDRSPLLKDDVIPYLLIAGEKDNYIPIEAARSIPSLGPNIEFVVLNNSGHMGFIEEPEKSAEILREFWGRGEI